MTDINKVETEILRRVHQDSRFIEIGEWPDSPEYLELRTTGENVGYFGKLNISLSPRMAMHLGHALIAAATEKGAT